MATAADWSITRRSTGAIAANDVVYNSQGHLDNDRFCFFSLFCYGGRARLLRLHQLGRAAKIPDIARRLLPPALSPLERGGTSPASRAHRFFKGLASWIGFRQTPCRLHPLPSRASSTTFSPGRLSGFRIEGPNVFLGGALRFCESSSAWRCCVRRFLFGLSILCETWVDGNRFRGYPRCGRPDDHLRRAAHHDRHRRRIYRKYSGELKALRSISWLNTVSTLEGNRAQAPARGPPPNERPVSLGASCFIFITFLLILRLR